MPLAFRLHANLSIPYELPFDVDKQRHRDVIIREFSHHISNVRLTPNWEMYFDVIFILQGRMYIQLKNAISL